MSESQSNQAERIGDESDVSRTRIHEESTKQADDLHDLEFTKQDEIHAADVQQVSELQRSLSVYQKENRKEHEKIIKVNENGHRKMTKEYRKGQEEIKQGLSDLSWLAHPDFKNTIIRIVKDEQGRTWLMIKIITFLKYAGMVIGVVGGIFAIGWAIWREFRK